MVSVNHFCKGYCREALEEVLQKGLKRIGQPDLIDTDRSYLLQLILRIRLSDPPTTIFHIYRHFIDTYVWSVAQTSTTQLTSC